jgi:hypothetical protein
MRVSSASFLKYSSEGKTEGCDQGLTALSGVRDIPALGSPCDSFGFIVLWVWSWTISPDREAVTEFLVIR